MEMRQAGTVTYVAWQMRDAGVRATPNDEPTTRSSGVATSLAKDFVAKYGGRRLRSGKRPVVTPFPTPTGALAAALELARKVRELEPSSRRDALTAVLYLTEVSGAEDESGFQRVKQMLESVGRGQTIVSLPVQDMLRDRLPESFRFDEVGTVSVGEPSRRERIFALVDANEPRAQRQTLNLDVPSSNLPLLQTAFFGRYMEIAAIRDALDGSRLITLTGGAGVGKTRVALHTTHMLLDEIPGSAAFVDLTPLKSTRSAAQAILDALQLRRDPGVPLIDNLVEGIGDTPILLILDNCEHLLPQLSQLVDNLLVQCSQLKVLATSREQLRLKSERAVLIPPMETPAASEEMTPERLLSYESIRLFVDRADASRAGFKLTDQNAADVARICRRLDGIPLAIELAASKMSLLTPAQLLERMVSQFDLLSTPARNIDPKHRTLWSALSWSYNTLSAAESALFRRLAVFQDHFSIEDVEGLFEGDPGLRGEHALSLLAQLLEKSLITVRDKQDGSKSFRLFAAVHEFAHEKLRECGELEDAARRHFDWYYSLVLKAADGLDRLNEAGWFARFDDDYENFKAALVWCLANTTTSKESCDFSFALLHYWDFRGLQHEGRLFIEESILRFGVDDVPTIACQHVNAAAMAANEGKPEMAHDHLRKALQMCEEANYSRGIAAANRNLAVLLEREGKYAEALEVNRRAGELWQEMGNERQYWAIQANIVFLLNQVGKSEDAVTLGKTTLAAVQKLDATEALPFARQHLAEAYFTLGQSEKAEVLIEEAISDSRGFGSDFLIGRMLDVCARIAVMRGEYERATVLLGSQRALCVKDGHVMFGSGRELVRDIVCDLRLSLGDDFETYWDRGLAMDEDEVAAFVLGSGPSFPTYRQHPR